MRSGNPGLFAGIHMSSQAVSGLDKGPVTLTFLGWPRSFVPAYWSLHFLPRYHFRVNALWSETEKSDGLFSNV
jgi:hypothetical protein